MSDPIRIIAFDPGEATGWATGTVEDGHLHVTDYGYDPWKTVLMRFEGQMLETEAPLYDHVVYESWRLRKDKMKTLVGSDMQSSKFIGGMMLVVWILQLRRHRPVQLFTNEPGNKTSINGWMKAAGKGDYLPSSDKEHPRDAVRHLYFHAITRLNVKEENCHARVES